MILNNLSKEISGALSEDTATIYKQDEKDWCKDKTCVRKEKREKKRGAAIADRDVCLPTKIYDPDWC